MPRSRSAAATLVCIRDIVGRSAHSARHAGVLPPIGPFRVKRLVPLLDTVWDVRSVDPDAIDPDLASVLATGVSAAARRILSCAALFDLLGLAAAHLGQQRRARNRHGLQHWALPGRLLERPAQDLAKPDGRAMRNLSLGRCISSAPGRSPTASWHPPSHSCGRADA